MTWTDLKESITQDYRSRGLKDAQARLNALKRVESMLFEIFPDFDGIVLCNMDKDDLKQILESKKGKKLSGSENNVVNEIYNRLPVIRSQSEIDEWIKNTRNKTEEEIREEAIDHINRRRIR